MAQDSWDLRCVCIVARRRAETKHAHLQTMQSWRRMVSVALLAWNEQLSAWKAVCSQFTASYTVKNKNKNQKTSKEQNNIQFAVCRFMWCKSHSAVIDVVKDVGAHRHQPQPQIRNVQIWWLREFRHSRLDVRDSECPWMPRSATQERRVASGNKEAWRRSSFAWAGQTLRSVYESHNLTSKKKKKKNIYTAQ